MMLSSSQVLDHQLIFYIMYGLGQLHHWQNKGEERRGEIWQKNNSCLANIEQQLMIKNSHKGSKSKREDKNNKLIHRADGLEQS